MEQITSAQLEKLVENMKQWVIGAGEGKPVLPKTRFAEHPERNYNLLGLTIRKFLQHEEQTYGINLGWTDDASPQTGTKVARWFFVRGGTGDEPVRYGEAIALGNGGDPSFIKYEQRTVGINLNWSKTPVFEWKIGGGRSGEVVSTGQHVALFNEKANEVLIYFDRNVGGDIGWPSTKRWEEQLKDIGSKEAVEFVKKHAIAALFA
jgi:hypothetical protein